MTARTTRLALSALLALALGPLSGCEEAPPAQKGPLVNPGPGPAGAGPSTAAGAKKPGGPAQKVPADPGPPSAAKP